MGAAPLARPLTGRPRPSDASPTSRHGSDELKLIAGELPATAVGRASISDLSLNPWDTQDTPYSILTSMLASMMDGGTNRASTGRHKQTQRQPLGAQGLAAHRDFNGARSTHGGASAEIGEEWLGLELRRVRACARGRKWWLGLGRSCWGVSCGLEGSEEGEFGGRIELVGVGCERKKERVGQWSDLYHKRRRLQASTSPGDTGRQAAACPHGHTRRCARGGRARQGRCDPYRITVAVHILPLFVPLRNYFKI